VFDPDSSQFDFQTDDWHAGGVSTVPLADLPGRPCPIAAALEVVGERWALLVVREIALGATRFSDIVRGTGAPRDRIAARLKTLTSAGVITRVPYQSAPQRDEYRLTDSGRALIPVLDALLSWGKDHAVDPDDPGRPRRYRAIADRLEERRIETP
jgi:DNA-binding HxlR family transcriptional regulator